MTEIITTHDIAFDHSDLDDHDGPTESLTATTTSAPDAKIEFHVQMRDWTLHDMEMLIVEAAAQQIVGRVGRPNDLSKQIEARVRELLVAKADERLALVTAEIIDQPVTPAFGDKKPVTMREMIGLYGREYLTQKVGSDGKPSTDTYGRHTQTRMAYLVQSAMDMKFKREIEAATNAAISEVQKMIRDQHIKLLSAEKARVRAAIDKEIDVK
jgi:hypothetical protein